RIIRVSRDQSSFDSFPRLFAVFHALHRLLAPRHPPHALSSLTAMIATLLQAHRLQSVGLLKEHNHCMLRIVTIHNLLFSGHLAEMQSTATELSKNDRVSRTLASLACGLDSRLCKIGRAPPSDKSARDQSVRYLSMALVTSSGAGRSMKRLPRRI